MVVILSSPSGAGKSTLARMILATDDDISLSISVTTRAPRAGEVDGVDYHFIDHETYTDYANTGYLIEYAQVFDHDGYGTPKQPVLDALSSGHDILFDIDWQGALQINSALAEDVVNIFILPPSRQELEARLKRRASDAPEVIQRRMDKADQEISHFSEYDWVLINADLKAPVTAILGIIAADRIRLKRHPLISQFAESLRSNCFKNA